MVQLSLYVCTCRGITMLPLLFVVSLALTGVTEGAGVLQDGPRNATVGGSVMFNTTLSPPVPQITLVIWKFGVLDMIRVRPPPAEDEIHPDYHGRVTVSDSTWSLELRNLVVSDAGEYGVTIIPSTGPTQTGSTSLRVYAPVSSVTVEPAATDLVEFSDSLRLSCSSSGSSLSYCWMKDSSEVTAGDRVQITDGGTMLTIVNVTRSDQGTYTCRVSNPVSSGISNEVAVSVSSPVSSVRLDAAATDLVEFSDSLRLSCSSSGSSLSYHWMKDSSEVTAGDRVQITGGGTNLTIVNVTRSDQGNYTCKVSNPVSSGISDEVAVSVSYGPENTRVTASQKPPQYAAGSNINLTCSADSRPAAQFTWFVNGTELPTTGPELPLMKVTVNQTGSYSCEAFNTRTLRHQTSEPLDITVVEKISGASVEPTQLIIEGTSVNLTCEASGSVWSRSWMKDGSALILGGHMNLYENNRVLSFDPVSRKDKGEYVCTIGNPLSTMEAKFSMIVYYGPEKVEITGKSLIPVGNSLNLICSADSVPLANFTWLFNGTELSNPSAVLNKNTVSYSDSGTYTCNASNQITGNTSSTETEITVTASEGGTPEPACDSGCIAGIVIGVLVLIAAVGGLGYYFTQRKKSRKRSTTAGTGGGAQENSAYASEVNYADLKFFKKKNGETMQMGSQNTETNYSEVRVANNRPAASSPPTYDGHMQRTKRPAPQPGADGVPTYARKNHPQ